jgi:DNA-binding NtrC family response regulator
MVPPSVLLVDDEVSFTETLSKRIEKRDLKVATASSGADAIETLDKGGGSGEFDVVILDIKMPGMDGIETLKQIKARHPVVAVILLTGHGTVETSVKGLKSGAFDYLLKPADFDELTAKLEAARKQKDEHAERLRAAEAKALMRRSGGLFNPD